MKGFLSSQLRNEIESLLRKPFLGRVSLKVILGIGWRIIPAFMLAAVIISGVHKVEKEAEITNELDQNLLYKEERKEEFIFRDIRDIVKVENVEAFAILVAGIIYLLEIKKRVGESTEKVIRYVQVFEIIDDKSGKINSHARIKALEYLTNHNESLAGRNFEKLDLQGINLIGGTLKGCKLSKANLREAKLEGVDFQDADLRKASLRDAILRDASLINANLEKADLYGSKLRRANLKEANFKGANLRNAKLKRVKNIQPDNFKECLYNQETKLPSDFPEEIKKQMYLIAPKVDLSNLDLRGSSLYEADLSGANLNRTDLRKADLSNAILKEANLQKSDLRGANLTGADLKSAKFAGSIYDKNTQFPEKFDPEDYEMYRIGENTILEGADLSKMKLNGCNLENSNLQNAKLIKAELKGTHLNNADLENAKLNNADLRGTDLSKVNLEGANFTGCLYSKKTNFPENFDFEKYPMFQISPGEDLRNQNLSGYQLKNAKLKGANLRDTNFTNADLNSADLRNANLRGTNFANVNLTDVKFEGCLYDDKTKFPDSLDIDNETSHQIVPKADLSGRCLKFTDLSKAKLIQANLINANLEGSDLSNANLSQAELKNTDFTGTKLSNANLSNSNLTNANLSGADLTEVNFNKANLEGTNFKGADLTGADFRYADNVTPEQIREAQNWGHAKYSKKLNQELNINQK